MHWIDIIIIVVVAISAFAGLKEGAVRMVFGLAGLLLGVFLAGKFGSFLAQAVMPNVGSWNTIVAYVVIFVATAIVSGIAGSIVSRIVHATLLGWVDRLIGVIAGALSGLLTVAAVLAALSVFMAEAADMARQSGLGLFLLSWSPFLLALLPNEILNQAKTGSV
jgi:membrane protein required for colicin V production